MNEKKVYNERVLNVEKGNFSIHSLWLCVPYIWRNVKRDESARFLSTDPPIFFLF